MGLVSETLVMLDPDPWPATWFISGWLHTIGRRLSLIIEQISASISRRSGRFVPADDQLNSSQLLRDLFLFFFVVCVFFFFPILLVLFLCCFCLCFCFLSRWYGALSSRFLRDANWQEKRLVRCVTGHKLRPTRKLEEERRGGEKGRRKETIQPEEEEGEEEEEEEEGRKQINSNKKQRWLLAEEVSSLRKLTSTWLWRSTVGDGTLFLRRQPRRILRLNGCSGDIIAGPSFSGCFVRAANQRAVMEINASSIDCHSTVGKIVV